MMVCVMRESQEKDGFTSDGGAYSSPCFPWLLVPPPLAISTKTRASGFVRPTPIVPYKDKAVIAATARASSAVTGHRYSLQIIPPASPKPAEQNKLIRQQFRHPPR